MRTRENPAIAEACGLLQQGHYEKALDAVKAFLQKKPRSLAVRLRALEVAATAYAQLGRHAEEVGIRRERLAVIRKAGLAGATEEAALAKALIALGRYQEAEEALGPEDARREDTERAEFLLMKATVILRRSRDYDTTVEMLRQAYRLVEASGTPLDRGRLKVRIGHALRFAGKITEAREALTAGQAELAKVLDEDPRAEAEYSKSDFILGDTYRLTGELHLAIQSYERAKQRLGPRASAHFVKRYYQRTAIVFYMLQRFAEAREAYLNEECLAAVKRIGNPEDFFWSYLGAAKSYLAEGALTTAEEFLVKAVEAAGEGPSAFIRGHVALTRGSVYQRRGAWDAAENRYKEAERAFGEIGNGGHLPGIVDCLVNLGLLAVDRNQQDRAIELANRCGEMSERCGYHSVYGRELLLKSTVLAEYDGDLDDLFKDVFDRLDAIACPATRFKVVANIYHYGRKFRSYDLDVKLEAKLNELRDVLDRSVYDQLRRTYFDSRFAQRIVKHLTDGPPPAESE